MGGGHFIFEMEDDPTEKPTFDEIMQGSLCCHLTRVPLKMLQNNDEKK